MRALGFLRLARRRFFCIPVSGPLNLNDVVETVTTTAADALSDAMEPDQVPESDKAKEIKEGCEKDRQGNN
jgi:hypothetical protein